jgi:hypothetical protein
MPEINYAPDPRDGLAPASRAFDCCDPCVGPTAPSGLVLNAAGAFVIDLSWTDNSSDETGFDIRWRNLTTGSSFTSIASNAPDDTTAQITVTGATDGDNIEVSVRATGTSCDSDWITDEVIIVDTN